MFRMVDRGTFNALTKFESQILSYKQDTEFKILCFVNKARVQLLYTNVLCWYMFQYNAAFCFNNATHKHTEAVYLFYHKLFCQRSRNFFTFYKL